MSEFIYILENSSMPGLVKIGRTDRSVSERVSELSSHTGVPTGFAVVKEYVVPNSVEAERIIHERLSNYRVAENREFFKMVVEDAIDIVESVLERVKAETRRDFSREDELVARAIPIIVEHGTARPRVLEDMLGISYDEALVVIHALRGRGIIGQRNESKWTARSKPPVGSPKSKTVAVASPVIGNYQRPHLDCLSSTDATIKSKVLLRDLIESDEWQNSKARIPLALGGGLNGCPLISDLAEMPNLLIAGESGSGKSVCLNSIMASLLYRFSPNELRFVLIDPNGVELDIYNSLPHLAVPIVSDPRKAVLALRWVVNEMEKRFQIFIRTSVTSIISFNGRPKTNFGLLESDIIIPERLSYVVVIIENLEELMQVAKADMERALNLLTQNGRAAGIHLVLTTRQADQNVISEGIKAEIPARIAFRCASRIESRTIVGEAGAEKLLGKGDMLCLMPGMATLNRAQGALITDREMQRIVDFISRQGKPSFDFEIQKKLSPLVSSLDADQEGLDEDEDLIQQCIEVIRSEQKASVSLLQRRLRLGYGRAARIMDELENRGVVGSCNGAEPREVLNKPDSELYTTPVEPPPLIRPQLVVCVCEDCNQKIEFDANELGDRQSVSVPCPHCGAVTELSNPC